MTQEVLKLALEFIERVNKDGWILADFEPEMYKAITALKEALAQPEQEPVAWMVTYGGLTNIVYTQPTEVVDTHYQPLYAAPPQREWVGLTDEEILEAWHWGGFNPHIEGAHFKVLYQYFEAKLNDKNT